MLSESLLGPGPPAVAEGRGKQQLQEEDFNYEEEIVLDFLDEVWSENRFLVTVI